MSVTRCWTVEIDDDLPGREIPTTAEVLHALHMAFGQTIRVQDLPEGEPRRRAEVDDCCSP